MQDAEFRVGQDFPDQFEPVFEGWEESVAVDFALDEGEVEVGAPGKCLGIDVGAAADEGLATAGEGAHLVPVPGDADSGPAGVVAGEDDGFAAREWSADGFEGAPAHDEDVAEGGLAEPAEVFRQMPGQPAVGTDDAVQGHGGDGDEGLCGGGWIRLCRHGALWNGLISTGL